MGLYEKEKNSKRGLKRFQAIIRDGEEKGFEVIPEYATAVFDEANIQLGQEIQDRTAEGRNELILIELAQRNSREGFRYLVEHFPTILDGAYFAFVDASPENRLQRVHERNLTTEGAHYLTDAVLERFKTDAKPYITTYFKTEFNIPENRIDVIENNEDENTFLRKITNYTETKLFPITGKESLLPKNSIEG